MQKVSMTAKEAREFRKAMATAKKIRKGDKVEVTGHGRTAKWGKTVGTVLSARGGSVYVVWDGCSFEDEMEPAEVKLYRGETADGYWGLAFNNDGREVQVFVPNNEVRA